MPLPRYRLLFRHSILSDTSTAHYIPDDIFSQLLPDTERKEINCRTTRIENDWRHGQVQVEWIDFPMQNTATSTSQGDEKTTRSKRTGVL